MTKQVSTWSHLPASSRLANEADVLTGYEPRRLFNVVQFVMNDKEGSGNVSLEGAMQILYLRYGRGLLDAQLEEIFGTSDLNSGMCLQRTTLEAAVSYAWPAFDLKAWHLQLGLGTLASG